MDKKEKKLRCDMEQAILLSEPHLEDLIVYLEFEPIRFY
jgi:hypothetical protein